MKKIGIIALALVIALSMCACRRNNDMQPSETEPSVTQEATTPDVLPEIDPTLDTNTPDPSVESGTHSNEGVTDDSGNSQGTNSGQQNSEQQNGNQQEGGQNNQGESGMQGNGSDLSRMKRMH